LLPHSNFKLPSYSMSHEPSALCTVAVPAYHACLGLPWYCAITGSPGRSGRGADRSPGGSKHPLSLRPDSLGSMQARVTCHGECVTILLPRGWLLNRVV
jgi:hypothetical protein